MSTAPDAADLAAQVRAAIPDQLFVSVPEAAAILGVDPRTARRAIDAGQLPGFKVGVFWKVPTAWLCERAGLRTSEAGH
jgi:excisionase family DNA binding protein